MFERLFHEAMRRYVVPAFHWLEERLMAFLAWLMQSIFCRGQTTLRGCLESRITQAIEERTNEAMASIRQSAESFIWTHLVEICLIALLVFVVSLAIIGLLRQRKKDQWVREVHERRRHGDSPRKKRSKPS